MKRSILLLLLAVSCTKTPSGLPRAGELPSNTSAPNVPDGWKTYTYKNVSFQYPNHWRVIVDSEVADQPSGFFLHVQTEDDGGFQPDEFTLSTSNDRVDKKSDYWIVAGRQFIKNQSGNDYIQFQVNNVTLYSACAYHAKGQPTLDICNQIVSTVTIK